MPIRQRLGDEQKIAWLRLIRTEGIGPVTFRELLNRFGGAAAALEALPGLGARTGRRLSPPTRDAVLEELERAAAIGSRPLFLGDPDYPPGLAALEVPPPMVYGLGDAQLASRPTIAVVGSRNASAAGRSMARALSHDLGAAGFVVVSGLARGVDGAAHEASLPTGTIAVVAGGLDHIYPPEHADLHARLAREGFIVSERAPGAVPRSEDFPRRNRIISGLSAGVVVVEAAARSGSLITARFAAEQGREVFAVPGHPLDPRAKGALALLREGATICTCADDVAEALRPILAGRAGQPDLRGFATAGEDWMLGLEQPPSSEPSGADAPPDQQATGEVGDRAIAEVVEAALSMAPIEVDVVARETGLTIREVRAALLELDLAGRIERHGLQTVSLRN
ncbi:MAG: DNA-protecting protein DprA [Rhizobiales bacterium]|nr:DNA-protecting protein DprA [Hyphomicrobiales bacterium]